MAGQGTKGGDATGRETGLGSQAGATIRLPAAAGPPGPAPTIALEAIEVTQAIQDLAMSVPLIAGKVTIVRVCLGSSFGPIVVRATLRVTSGSDPSLSQSVSRIADLEIDPAYNGQVATKRQDITRSLNFIWPKDLCLAGDWTVVLESLERIDVAQSLLAPAFPGPIVTFQSSPPLRVHVVGLRYNDGNAANTVEPAPLDFELLRSWLGRAYPVAEVIWSQVTVDFSKPWKFQASDVNQHLRDLRDADVQAGTDARTHFYGLVDDDGGKKFMQGWASAIPGAADPSVVASGPTGVPRDPKFTWDTDGSYGDWYGGHELAHTFGREHANYCGASGGSVPYPYSGGQLFDDDTRFIGLDVGDAAHAIPMRALPATVWHDIMTYCEYQWPSDFTYIGIRDRLLIEEMLTPTLPPSATTSGGGMTAAGGSVPAAATAVGASGGSGAMSPNPSIHVVATVNLTQWAAGIPSVTPRRAAAFPPHPVALDLGKAAGLELQLLDADGETLWKAPAPFVPDVCRNEEDADETGLVDMTAPNPPGVARIALLRQGKELAHFNVGLTPQPVHDIRPLAAAASRGLAPTSHPINPVLTWSDEVRDQFVAADAKAGAPDTAPTYLVQVSTDDRHTWRTIGLGLKQPQVTIDRNLLRGAGQVIVRVTSTDGVHAASQEKTFNVQELVPLEGSFVVRDGRVAAPANVGTEPRAVSSAIAQKHARALAKKRPTKAPPVPARDDVIQSLEQSRRRIARFGWVRDELDHRDQLFSVPFTVLSALPRSVDLRAQCPPVYDQGRIGSSTANAIAGAIQFGRKKNGQLPDFAPSRLFIYYNERAIEHSVANDAGAQLRDGIKAVNKLGVCPETEWPYNDTPAVTDGGPFPPGSKPATRPSARAYHDAKNYTGVSYQRLVQNLGQLKGCLAQGFPFVFGFTVYDSIYDASGNPKTIFPLPSPTDTPIGGHAIMAVGYDDDKLLFTVRNSWGTAVGDAGYFYMPYSYVTDSRLASDFWIIRTIAH